MSGVPTVHLVDGTYELFRAHYGAPSARTPSGQPAGATRGLLRTLLALVEPGRADGGATHVAVAFDTVIESFRNRLFDGYKTGDGIEPELRAQFELAERAARALGFVTWSMTEFEADDALATAAARLADDPSVHEVVICSPDKDLAQCVGPKVVCLDRRRQARVDAAAVHERFGVPPSSIPDWLALVGDAADGIPGVPRWGEKSASAVLGRYLHLELIPDDSVAWGVTVRGAAALAQSLTQHRDASRLYRTLATLRRDVPLEFSVGSLAWRGAVPELLVELCEEIGDGRFAERALARRP